MDAEGREHQLQHSVFHSRGPQPFWHQGAVLGNIIFPHTMAEGLVWGGFKHTTFIVHFISIIITSAPPQIILCYIPEIGDPCFLGRKASHL